MKYYRHHPRYLGHPRRGLKMLGRGIGGLVSKVRQVDRALQGNAFGRALRDKVVEAGGNIAKQQLENQVDRISNVFN